MTNGSRTYPLYCVLTLFLSPSAGAQTQSDTAFYHRSLTHLASIYKNEMGADSRLYMGAQYMATGQRAKGSVFFLADTALPGAVLYHGEWYENISLQYDLLADQIFIKDYTRSYDIQLTKEKIQRFTLGGHEFVYINPDPASATTGGYYEWLHKGAPSTPGAEPTAPGFSAAPGSSGAELGPFSLFVRHEKKVVLPANPEDPAYYRQDNSWFLLMDDRLVEVDGKSSLLSLLKDKKDVLKKFIRDNHIDFGKDLQQALIKTIDYYAQLKHDHA